MSELVGPSQAWMRPVARARHRDVNIPLRAWARAQGSRAGAPLRRRAALQAARSAALLEPRLRACSQEELDRRRRELGLALRRHGLIEPVIIETMALVREACRRTIGLVPFVEQLAGGYGLLFDAAVEMDTGEGKTLTTLIPGSVRALAGRSVHVVTANDYLADRDGKLLRPAFESLGLSVGIVTHESAPPARRGAYACNVTFVSNKEVAFDFLRDRLITPRYPGAGDVQLKMRKAMVAADAFTEPLLPELDVAIVDELDSVLIDDAGTPLVISATTPSALDDATARQAIDVGGQLSVGEHFIVDLQGTAVELTAAGRERIAHMTEHLGGAWRHRIRRSELARQAVTAKQVLKRGLHYLVEDDKVIMIDTYSGRRMPDRYWGQDLHRLIELKEDCGNSGTRKSLASISFQRFFRSYRTLSGMSGTVSEVADEFARVYGLRLVRIPRRLPNRRRGARRRVFADRARLWAAAAQYVRDLHDAGRPVLIGVRSVVEAERASEALQVLGIRHDVLSAANHAEEAAIVARAGVPGAVTVATNMAGRGTDIVLGEGVAGSGGLVVMLCERHDSRRVDRQLMGRCGRQGDPGLTIEFVSAGDTVLNTLPPGLRGLAKLTLLGPTAAGLIFRLAQLRAERAHAARRIELVRRDLRLGKLLAFAGGLD
jgi:preprotein translocase subunit SecA